MPFGFFVVVFFILSQQCLSFCFRLKSLTPFADNRTFLFKPQRLKTGRFIVLYEKRSTKSSKYFIYFSYKMYNKRDIFLH